MKRRKSGSGRDERESPPRRGPDVSSIIDAMEESRGALLSRLRDMGLSLPGVEERAVYDGFCREWTPAYHLTDRQLFHVHNFRSGLRATIFVGVKALEPIILESDMVPLDLRLAVAKTSGNRGTKMVKVSINSIEDVDSFAKLVLVKWGLGRQGSSAA